MQCPKGERKGREGHMEKTRSMQGPPSRAMVAGHLFQRSSAEGFSTMSKMHSKRHVSRPPPRGLVAKSYSTKYNLAGGLEGLAAAD